MQYSEKKCYIFDFKNVQLNLGVYQYDTTFNWLDTKQNCSLTFKVDNLIHTSWAGSTLGGYSSIFGGAYHTFINTSVVVDVKNAITEVPLFGLNLVNPVATPELNTVKLNCDNHIKIPCINAPANVYQEALKRNIIIFSGYTANGNMGKLLITGNYYNAESEVVSMDGSSLDKNVEISGLFKTTAVGKHVVILNAYNRDKGFAITDAILINDSTVPSVKVAGMLNGYAQVNGGPFITPRQIYFKNVHVTATLDASINAVGDTVFIEPDLINYL